MFLKRRPWWICNPSYWYVGISGRLVYSESAKRHKMPCRGSSKYLWFYQGQHAHPDSTRGRLISNLPRSHTVNSGLEMVASLKKIYFSLLIKTKFGKKQFLQSYIYPLRAELNCTIMASPMGRVAGAS